MSSEDPQAISTRFKNFADIITGGQSGYGQIYTAVHDLNALFLELGAADPNAGMYHAGTNLSSGFAISTGEAARCMFDLARTVKFSRGLIKAIKHKKKLTPGMTVRVLYAGCGPYALLALLAIPCFSETEVKFTAIDIHESSVDSAKKLAAALGLENYFDEIIQADAFDYSFSEKDILLVEVMQQALRKEPQVSVAAALAVQLSEGGIMIPERITIKPAFTDLKKRDAIMLNSDPGFSSSFEYNSIADLDLRSVFKVAKDFSNPFPVKKIILDESYLGPGFVLELFTIIKVWNDEILSGFDSAITLPLLIARGEELSGKKSVTFNYRNDALPGFNWEAE